QEIKENFTIKDAIIQVVNMSEISKKQNLAEYNENISTPFTRALRTKILSNLSKMYSESKWHCEYVSATLENSENKTFLDVFHATDAFALIYDDKGCMMIELIDFTIDPR